MTLFRDTYRVESARHPTWDYRSPGWYFVTVCTHQRIHFLGTIRHGTVGLSEAGCIVAQEWQRTPQVRPYVVLDAWIIMPNHFHGLIGIRSDSPGVSNGVETPRRGVSTGKTPTLHAHSLGAIIGRIKSVCTKRIRRTVRPDFAWQSRFHDRIVRNKREFYAIRQYIVNNPARWTEDPLHTP